MPSGTPCQSCFCRLSHSLRFSHSLPERFWSIDWNMSILSLPHQNWNRSRSPSIGWEVVCRLGKHTHGTNDVRMNVGLCASLHYTRTKANRNAGGCQKAPYRIPSKEWHKWCHYYKKERNAGVISNFKNRIPLKHVHSKHNARCHWSQSVISASLPLKGFLARYLGTPGPHMRRNNPTISWKKSE